MLLWLDILFRHSTIMILFYYNTCPFHLSTLSSPISFPFSCTCFSPLLSPFFARKLLLLLSTKESMTFQRRQIPPVSHLFLLPLLLFLLFTPLCLSVLRSACSSSSSVFPAVIPFLPVSFEACVLTLFCHPICFVFILPLPMLSSLSSFYLVSSHPPSSDKLQHRPYILVPREDTLHVAARRETNSASRAQALHCRLCKEENQMPRY